MMGEYLELETFLKGLRDSGKKVFYNQNGGNAGDALINVGFYTLAEKVGLRFDFLTGNIQDLDSDCVVLIAGGGTIVPEWSSVPDAIRCLIKTPVQIVVLPQSIKGHADLLSDLRSSDVVFLREKYSYDYCKSLNLSCQLFVDSDTAFHTDVGKLLSLNYTASDIPLDNAKNVIRRFLYVYHLIRSKLFKTIQAFRCDKEAMGVKKRRLYNDLSLIAAYGGQSKERDYIQAFFFLKMIKSYQLIETDRLHVMVGSVLVGTSVRVYSNNYHKIKGVFEYSISTSDAKDTVSWVE